jgi:enoyl-CoA hydratase/carnithine racemase
MATDKLLTETKGTVGIIIFNNPERRNAVSPDMWDGIEEALDEFIPNDAIRVVVLTGAGGKSFVSGSDISAFDKVRSTPEQIEKYNETSNRVHQTLMGCPKPTIAMINGFCMGGGAGFALDCDLRICSDKSQFGIPAAKLGLGYKFSSIRRLVDVVGPANAKEILFTGGRFSAQEAYHMGLVNKVVPEADLENTVMEYAQTIGDNAPMTIASIKTIIANIVKDPSDRDLAECERMVDACFKSEDYIEGRTAFMEKRKPDFKGR